MDQSESDQSASAGNCTLRGSRPTSIQNPARKQQLPAVADSILNTQRQPFRSIGCLLTACDDRGFQLNRCAEQQLANRRLFFCSCVVVFRRLFAPVRQTLETSTRHIYGNFKYNHRHPAPQRFSSDFPEPELSECSSRQVEPSSPIDSSALLLPQAISIDFHRNNSQLIGPFIRKSR